MTCMSEVQLATVLRAPSKIGVTVCEKVRVMSDFFLISLEAVEGAEVEIFFFSLDLSFPNLGGLVRNPKVKI